jgi:hypothetical protein
MRPTARRPPRLRRQVEARRAAVERIAADTRSCIYEMLWSAGPVSHFGLAQVNRTRCIETEIDSIARITGASAACTATASSPANAMI